MECRTRIEEEMRSTEDGQYRVVIAETREERHKDTVIIDKDSKGNNQETLNVSKEKGQDQFS